MNFDYKKRANLIEILNGYYILYHFGFLGNKDDDCMDHSLHWQSERNWYEGQVYLHINSQPNNIKIPISDDQLMDIAKQIIGNNIKRANELQECLIMKDV
jgi:hypothetical protein